MTNSIPGQDLYAILETDQNATSRSIDQSYRRLARKYHPDVGGDVEFMKLLNEAYRVVGDEVRRSEYDLSRAKVEDSYFVPFSSATAHADPISGRVAMSLLCIGVGLSLLFLIRFQWIWFLWPIAALAIVFVVFGVLMARSAMHLIRRKGNSNEPGGGYTKLREAVFWSTVIGGGYGVYLVLSGI